MVCLSTHAIGQIIPGSDRPGREREQFSQPPVARAQPGGGAISLPTTVAPPGAENIRLLVRDVRIVGATVYRPDELAQS